MLGIQQSEENQREHHHDRQAHVLTQKIEAVTQALPSYSSVISILPVEIWSSSWNGGDADAVRPRFQMKEFREQIFDTVHPTTCDEAPLLRLSGEDMPGLAAAFKNEIKKAISSNDFSKLLSPNRQIEVYVIGLTYMWLF